MKTRTFLALPFAAALAACTPGQVVTAIGALEASMGTSTGQSLLAWISRAPQLQGVVARVNGGLASAQEGIRLACGALSIAHNANSYFGPVVGESVAELAKIDADFAIVEPYCVNPPTDARSAFNSLTTLASTIWDKLRAVPGVAAKA